MLFFLLSKAFAKNLPSPFRTIYKCEVGRKVHYSDSSCVGALKVDVTPTRGMNKSTGRELTGSDVRRDVFREKWSDAVRPITGMNAQQMELFKLRKRFVRCSGARWC